MSLLNFEYIDFLKYVFAYNDAGITTRYRCYNTSIVKSHDGRFIYAVRFTIITTDINFDVIPGNSVDCRIPSNIEYGHNFWWNNWRGRYPGNDITYFFIGDHRKRQLQLLKLQSAETNLNFPRINGYEFHEHDLRLTRINNIIYCYDTSLRFISQLILNNDTLVFVPLNTYKFLTGKNIPLLDYKNKAISLIDWFYSEGVRFLICEKANGPFCLVGEEYWIKSDYNPDDRTNGGTISGIGSYMTNKEDDIVEYGNNYGITPMFSFSTPHVNFNDITIGCGHIKIHANIDKFPYLPNSTIQNFRQNLYIQLKESYGDRYIRHFGTTMPPMCDGYIYMLFFYIINKAGKYKEFNIYDNMILSDAYLPLYTKTKLPDTEFDHDYKFSLIFPMGLEIDNETIIVTAGYGDFYSVALEYNVYDILSRCKHNIKNINMSHYQYYITPF
jgi:hypothetical protein